MDARAEAESWTGRWGIGQEDEDRKEKDDEGEDKKEEDEDRNEEDRKDEDIGQERRGRGGGQEDKGEGAQIAKMHIVEWKWRQKKKENKIPSQLFKIDS